MPGLMGNIMKPIFGMETFAEEFWENMKHAKSKTFINFQKLLLKSGRDFLNRETSSAIGSGKMVTNNHLKILFE